MKKTNFFGTAFSLLFVLFLFGTTAFAQSTDPDSPTLVTQTMVQGKITGEAPAYYYTFTAGPGVLKVTFDLKSQTTGGAYMDWQLTDANFKELESGTINGANAAGERQVKEINLTKKQKVILKAEGRADSAPANFKFQFTGAVAFTGGMSGGGGSNENIPEISGDTTTQSTQQICMPRNGVVIMTMKDGKKAKVDLSKVQKIEIQ